MSNNNVELGDLLLGSVPLFHNVAPESLQGIVDCCGTRTLERGEVLLRPDCENRELFVLLSGRLRVHLRDPGSEPIAQIEQGEVAGELSVIDGNPTSAYVIADAPSTLLVMDQELVWSLATVSHAAALNLLTMLSGRLRKANQTIVEKMLREHAFHSYGTVDALTGMHNRYWLDDALARMVKRSNQSGTELVVMMIDIDNFKEFDDTHGHLTGDRALHTVAQTLLENLRPTVMAARYGGDEFMIAFPDIDLAKGKEIAERLREEVEKKMIPHAPAPLPPVTISVGVAALTLGGTAEEVVAAADAALYRAKALGRNSVSY